MLPKFPESIRFFTVQQFSFEEVFVHIFTGSKGL
jgi:hypothetical protein